MNKQKILGGIYRFRALFLVVAFFFALVFGLSHHSSVRAATCSSSNVTFARVSASTFYVDSGFTYRYIGYSITTSSSKSYSDLYVTIDGFNVASGSVALSTDSAVEDGTYHVGALGTSSTAYVYFYLKSNTSSNNTAVQNFNLNLFNGSPSGSNLAECSSSQNTGQVESDGFANSNKVTSVTYTAPYLGSSFTMTVTGDSGTIGATQTISLSPASDGTWKADCLELRDTHVVLSGGNAGTYDHLLVLGASQLPSSANTHYVATYTFTAKCVTGSSTAVKPLSYISQGSSGMRHTDNSGFASLPPIAPATNSLILTKSNSPAASSSGGTTTYSIDIQNIGPSSASLDDIIDTLPSSPANASYATDTATYDDDVSGGSVASSIANPTISSQTLTWVRTFTVPSGKTGRLQFQTTIPSTVGSFVNSAVGHAGSSQIDQTVDTTNSNPATATYGVGSINMAASTKTASDINGGSLQPGDIIEYTITANNSGTSDATGVHISDTIDTNTNNLSNVVIGANGTDCGSSYSNNTTSTALDITNASVPHGTNCVVTFRVTVKSGTADGVTILNTASIVPSNAGAISGTPASSPMSVQKDPILSITNTENDADNVVTANQVITYTITITNSGQADASGVDLTGTISGPVGSVSSRTITNCGPTTTYVDTSSGSTLNIAALSIAVGTPCVISYTVTVNAGASSGSITNSVDITAAREGGNDPAVVSASTLLIGVAATPPNLSVSVAENDADGYVFPGQSVTYTINVTNMGQTDATTSLTSSIPSAMGTPGSLTYTNCGSTSSSFSAGVLTINLIAIPAANTCTITFVVTITSPLNEGTTLTVGVDVAQASQGGNDPANVNATTLTVDATPILNITSTENDADNVVTPSQDITYTITISNTGDGQATGVPLTSSFTGPVGSPSSFTLTNCGSSYANSSSSSVNITGLQINIGTNCVVVFHVTVNSNASGGSTITDSANITGATEGGNNPIPVSADTLTVAQSPSLSVDFTDDDIDNIVTPSQSITFTLTIHNTGNANGVTSAILTIPVAVGAPSSITYTHCGTGSSSFASSTLTLSSLTVTTANDCVVTFDTAVNSPSTENATFHLSADVAAAAEGGNNPSNVDSSTFTIDTTPNLSTSTYTQADQNGGTLAPGDTLRYTITLKNTGDGNGSGVLVTSVMDTNVALSMGTINLSNCGSGITNTSSSGSLSLANLQVAVGTNCVITFNGVLTTPLDEDTSVHTSATVGAASEGGLGASPSTGTLSVDATPNLSTSTYARTDQNGGTLAPGETIAHTITIKNTGNGTASGVSLLSIINTNTESLAIVSLSNCGSSYTDNSSVTAVNIEDLTITIGTNCVINYTTVVSSPLDEGTTISDSATVAVASEGGLGASLSSNALVIDSTPNFGVTFTENDSDNIVIPGQTVRYTLTITNSGNGSGTTVGRITIPTGMDTPSNVDFTHCGSPSSGYSVPTLTFSSLRVNTSYDCVVTFDTAVATPSSESITLTASVDVDTASEGGNNPTALEASTLSVNVTPHLVVSISDDDTDNIVGLGQTVESDILISNTGDGLATGVSGLYSLTGSASISSVAFSNCGSSKTENHSSTSLTLSDLQIAVSTPCTVHIIFQVATNATDGAIISQSIDINAATEGGNNPAAADPSDLVVDASNIAPNLPMNVSSDILSGNHKLNATGLVGAQLSTDLSDPDTADQVKYRIQISTDPSFANLAIDYRSTLGSQGTKAYYYQENSGSYLVGNSSTVLADGQYYIRLRTEDEKGASSAWYTIDGVAFNYDNTPPSKPNKPFLVGTVNGTTAIIGWDETTDSDPSALIPYRLEVSTTEDFSSFTDLDTADLSAIYTELAKNSHLYIRIYWRDATGNLSEPSDILDVFIPADVPAQTGGGGTTNTSSTTTPKTQSRKTLASTNNVVQGINPSGNKSAAHNVAKVSILVLGTDNKPVRGAKVTLHSQARIGYTDGKGIVNFSDVELGNHTVVVEYRGSMTSTLITMQNGVQELRITLTLKNAVQQSSWCWWWPILLILLLLYWYYRHRKRIRGKSQRPSTAPRLHNK